MIASGQPSSGWRVTRVEGGHERAQRQTWHGDGRAKHIPRNQPFVGNITVAAVVGKVVQASTVASRLR